MLCQRFHICHVLASRFVVGLETGLLGTHFETSKLVKLLASYQRRSAGSKSLLPDTDHPMYGWLMNHTFLQTVWFVWSTLVAYPWLRHPWSQHQVQTCQHCPQSIVRPLCPCPVQLTVTARQPYQCRNSKSSTSLWVPGTHRPWVPEYWEWVPSLMFKLTQQAHNTIISSLWPVGCSRQFWRSRQIWQSSPNWAIPNVYKTCILIRMWRHFHVSSSRTVARQ